MLCNKNFYSFLLKTSVYFSSTVGLLLSIVKLYGWIKTDSSSIFASLVDSLLDFTSSLINLFIVYYALKPPDEKHKFGHDKAQDLTVFGQAFFFISSGIFTIFVSIQNLINGHIITNPMIGRNIMIFSTIVVVVLLIYQSFVIYKTSSNIVLVDRLHYVNDLFTNTFIFISVYLSHKWPYIDAIFSVIMGIYIMVAASKLLRKSLSVLLDEEISKKDKQKLFEILEKYNEIKGIQELKTRRAGNKFFLQFYLKMDDNFTLLNTDKIIQCISQEIKQTFDQCEVNIYPLPFNEK